MTNRVTYAPHDFEKMCKQAERDHESKKLVLLMERVKRQISERQNPNLENPNLAANASKLPVKSASGDASMLRVVHPSGSL
jgi:hypothetical protein